MTHPDGNPGLLDQRRKQPVERDPEVGSPEKELLVTDGRACLGAPETLCDERRDPAAGRDIDDGALRLELPAFRTRTCMAPSTGTVRIPTA